MKTRHEIPLKFRFPSTEDIEIVHQYDFEISNREIETAMNESNQALFDLIDTEIKDHGEERIFALAIGICLLNSGQIDVGFE